MATTFEEHLRLLREVFTLLRDAGLTLKLEKCNFLRKEIKYLGVKITRDGNNIDNEKIEAITSMNLPKNSKEVATFLEIVAWFAKFIPRFSELCEPLNNLKRKRVEFTWSSTAHRSFELLKEAVDSPPVLSHPNYNSQFEVYWKFIGSLFEVY